MSITSSPEPGPDSPEPGPDAAADRGKTRIALVFGGRSGEHSVSCATAAAVLQAIDRDRYEVVPIGITRDGHWVLTADDPALLEGGRAEVTAAEPSRVLMPLGSTSAPLILAEPGQVPRELAAVDVVLPLLHGPFGEDGTIQGLLELAEVRYVGSGVLASAAGMDKHYMKIVLAAHGLPIGPHTVITPRMWQVEKESSMASAAALGWPVFVKPARAGSSLGVSRASNLEELEAAIEAARAHDPKVVVEAAQVGREIEIGVLQGRGDEPPRTTVPGEIVLESPAAGFYDYHTKYLEEVETMAIPAELPPVVAERLRDLAIESFTALGCEGPARVDFFVNGEDVVVNEVNTMPGFTPRSMYPALWQASGLSYPALLDELIALAAERPTGLR